MSPVETGFGGSTFSFMWSETALSAMRRMRTLGLNDFDALMVPGHLWHDELDASARRALAAALKADGIRIESLNLPALDHNLASVVPEARAYAVALFTEALRLGADLGGQAVVAVPGRVSGLFAPPQPLSEDYLAHSLEALLKVAEPLGQKIYIESHPQTPIPTVDRIERFLQRIPHPLLQVAYDVSNAEYVGEDQADALRRLAGRLGQVHLSDGTRTSWRHDRVGLGTVDFAAVQRTLQEIGFAGVQVLEIIGSTPMPDIAASLAALERPSRRARP
ncbi:sugar phosphate isomerase [Rhodoferax koreense]|uniref:Sugar phosphate isomerase n=1 Tax=Rhodoferax koreensis TaxID=1842727 RepID=A0A1P8K1D9_9BURK|nr:sugar phosphate isomerase/epimerase family protein [Rhodoferax koreense]APW39820.1 sugar phosphate isomerase [Rhodoferax koreense]